VLQSTPLVWIRWLDKVFKTEAKFACKLWAAYDPSPTVLYQLSLVDLTEEAPLELWKARMVRLYALIDPVSLFKASLTVAPENGKPRLPDAVRFEEALLYWLNAQGNWII
jgi:hypothetical protein